MNVLAFDTSAAHCAAALHLTSGQTVSTLVEMKKGQAESLMPLLEQLLKENDLTFADLDRIAIGVGPGNFTGIRISVAAARGLALSLEIPAIGVSQFRATWFATMSPCAVTVPAPRDQYYLQSFDENGQETTPQFGLLDTLDTKHEITPALDPADLVVQMARYAATLAPPFARPVPLYIKPADAAPSKIAPPVILDQGTAS